MHPAIKQVLLDCQRRQATGTLQVQGAGQQWWLYFFMGRLVYATGGVHRVRRWHRRLQVHCPHWQPNWQNMAAATPWEYAALVQGTRSGQLSPAQAKAVLFDSALEVMFAVLAQEATTWDFDTGQRLDPPMALLSVERVLEEAVQLHHQWQASGFGQLQRVAKHLSPDLAPLARQPECISDDQWLPWLNGQRTLWDLMALTRQSFQAVLGLLFPWVQQGWVELQMLPDLPVPAADQTGAASDNLDQPLIACLDDSPVMLKILENTLARAGYRVLTVPDPLQQMATLLEAKPDVILLDWMMPTVNGYELCSLLRKTSTFRDTPIFLITAHENLVNRTRARLAGVTEVLTKPVDPEALFALVSRYAPLRQRPDGVAGVLPTPRIMVAPGPEVAPGNPEAQARQLLERYAAGERDFTGLCLIGCNLQGANLEGINLSGANLLLANLSGCLLTGAKLVGANLMGAELVNANLRQATLSGANLIAAHCRQANFSGSQLVGSNLSTADFSHSRLQGADLSEALAAGANFTHADLRQATLYATNLHGAVLHHANLAQANLTGANLWQAQAEHVNWAGAELKGAVLPSTPNSYKSNI